MNAYATQLKNLLSDIIDDIAEHSSDYTISTMNHLSRKRKWDSATLIRFILSFGSNSLGYEIGEFFEYKKIFLQLLRLYNNDKNFITRHFNLFLNILMYELRNNPK